MHNSQIAQLDKLLAEASQYLDVSKSILDGMLTESIAEEESSIENKAYAIQLILQYRLNCEDALALLFEIDHQLLYLLGIQPQQSSKMNLERLSYEVGHEDFKHILSILSNLVDALSKIVSLYHKQQAHFSIKNKANKKDSHFIQALQKLMSQQECFLKKLTLFDHEIKQLVKLQAVGPLFDHVVGLRGPISQFHQAMIYHSNQAALFYQKINKEQLVDKQLDHLLKQAEDVLHLMPSIYKSAPHYFAKPVSHQLSYEQLEERATAKRLRPFFS